MNFNFLKPKSSSSSVSNQTTSMNESARNQLNHWLHQKYQLLEPNERQQLQFILNASDQLIHWSGLQIESNPDLDWTIDENTINTIFQHFVQFCAVHHFKDPVYQKTAELYQGWLSQQYLQTAMLKVSTIKDIHNPFTNQALLDTYQTLGQHGRTMTQQLKWLQTTWVAQCQTWLEKHWTSSIDQTVLKTQLQANQKRIDQYFKRDDLIEQYLNFTLLDALVEIILNGPAVQSMATPIIQLATQTDSLSDQMWYLEWNCQLMNFVHILYVDTEQTAVLKHPHALTPKTIISRLLANLTPRWEDQFDMTLPINFEPHEAESLSDQYFDLVMTLVSNPDHQDRTIIK